MVLGAALGLTAPEAGRALKPVADAFVRLVKMLLAPVIFATVATGIARMGDLRAVGRVGLRALVYFELMSGAALLLGLVVGELMGPGRGLSVNAAALDPDAARPFATAASAADAGGGVASFLGSVIPDSLLSALTGGSMLQVILVAVLAGGALGGMAERGERLVGVLEDLTAMLFRIVAAVMRLAPLGAGAGIAYTVGAHGAGTLAALAKLIATLYVTAALFVFVGLGAVMRAAGLRLVPLLRLIRDELLVVFGTCSTEAVLPQAIRKMTLAGVDPKLVGLVLPAGYAFNTDGTCIYLSMAVVFIAQATDTVLSVGDQATILGVLLLTSKGSGGVAGAGFVALAATLGAVPALPVAGLVLVLGVDRFLNEARAVTNLVGNCVATLAVARWSGALDMTTARRVVGPAPARAA